MQPDYHIKELLNKFILNKCSKEETEQVIAYLQRIKKPDELPSVEEIIKLLDEKPVMAEGDANRIYTNIQAIAKAQEKKVRRKHTYFWRYAAAAITVGVLTTAYFLRDHLLNPSVDTTPVIVNTNTIVPGTDKATLTLANGEHVSLAKGSSFKTQHVDSDGEKIIYSGDANPTTEITYNYLTIPRGGQFYVVLSDSTQVWLNSESQLKYPVSFKEGETRQVELVYGEAYFEVSPSINHKGAKFKVINKSQEVEVLGTEFNIKAYKDETNIYTTLVEGKVEVSMPVTKQILMPNQQLNLDLNTDNIIVAEIDVQPEISWKRGIFTFKGKPLKDIMKVIARWYDVDVVFVNKDLESVQFRGILNKDQSIEEVLSIMKSNSINNYRINNKTIILE